MHPSIRRRQWLAIAAFGLPFIAHGATLAERWQSRKDPQAQGGDAAPDQTRAGLRREIPLPEGARVLRDIPFGPDRQQRLDAYLPARPENAPIIFMVHGGAWMLGDKAYGPVVRNKVAHWLPKGYIVVSTNYRLSNTPRVLDQLDDVAMALGHVQTQAPRWSGDPRRILVMGHSAGAHLVALLAAATDTAKAHHLQPWLGTVSLDSAALNVVETMERRHAAFYDRVFGADPSFWATVSPMHRLTTAATPLLLVCATGRKDSVAQAHALAGRQRSLGGQASVLPVDMTHGDINTELGLPSAYTAQVDAFMRSLGLP